MCSRRVQIRHVGAREGACDPLVSRTMPDSKPDERRSLDLLEPDVTRSLVARLRLTRLLARLPERPIWALFVFVNGFVTMAMLAGLAWLTGSPFVFPSLGPTAFLFFFSPTSPTSSPRHTMYGHAIGIVCGYVALRVTGLAHAPPATVVGVDAPRVLAAALSLASTGALMILLKAAHPPAGATTLIVSLGIVTRPWYLLLIEVAVGVLTVQAIAINRLAGLDYPLWARRVAGAAGASGSTAAAENAKRDSRPEPSLRGP